MGAALVAGVLLPNFALLFPESSVASSLPFAADNAWEAIGGGPADLVFPDEFIGVWQVRQRCSALQQIDILTTTKNTKNKLNT